MRYWLIRVGTSSIQVDDDRRRFTVTARRTPRIAVGDHVVFLDRSPELGFRQMSTVTRVILFKGEVDSRQTTTFELKDPVALPAGLELDLLKFSLTIVVNTERPLVHFRRGYRLLPKVDFETLKDGEAFVARTGYIELLNALHPDLRTSFEVEEILAGNQLEGDQYRSRLTRLYHFLEIRVFAAGRLLGRIESLASGLALTDYEGVPVGHQFVAGEEVAGAPIDPSDDLAAQRQRFAELDQALKNAASKQVDLFDPEVDNEIAEVLTDLSSPERQASELRFERIFARLA